MSLGRRKVEGKRLRVGGLRTKNEECCPCPTCNNNSTLCACLDSNSTLDVEIDGFANQTVVQPCEVCTPSTAEVHVELLWQNFNGVHALDFVNCDTTFGATFRLTLVANQSCISANPDFVADLRANGILIAREWNVDCPDDGFSHGEYEAERYIREISAGLICDSTGMTFELSWVERQVWRLWSLVSEDWGPWQCHGTNPALFINTRGPSRCDVQPMTPAPGCSSNDMIQESDQNRMTQDEDDCIESGFACTGSLVTYTGVLHL